MKKQKLVFVPCRPDLLKALEARAAKLGVTPDELGDRALRAALGKKGRIGR